MVKKKEDETVIENENKVVVKKKGIIRKTGSKLKNDVKSSVQVDEGSFFVAFKNLWRTMFPKK